LYSDTSFVAPEVKRHCATLGLKIKSSLLSGNYYCIESAGKKILITNFLNNKIIHNYEPDFVFLTGTRPAISNDLKLNHPGCSLIFSSSVAPGFRIPQQASVNIADSIFFVRKTGAFIKRI
jgi:hypothetical protein